jgi:hypothetical protein
MPLKRPFLHLIIIGLTIFVIAGCDTTRNIYKSSSSQKDYFTINAVTLSHCGCTQIYAESFKNGKKEFQIFYNDNIARKTIFTYGSNSKTPETLSFLASTNDNFTTPFDQVDSRIFSIIDSVIVNKQGFVYPIKRTVYKGYVADTLLQR